VFVSVTGIERSIGLTVYRKYGNTKTEDFVGTQSFGPGELLIVVPGTLEEVKGDLGGV
tara:strand:+ start:147 stop:320 length:174 start_codon:yes stop_codon:yes gene_type:complete